jgi:hypothetical protein
MMQVMFAMLLLLGFSGEPVLVTDVPYVQIYRFDDRTVVVIPHGVNYNLTFPQPVELAVVGTDDATRFVSLPGSAVFHKPDCRIVAWRRRHLQCPCRRRTCRRAVGGLCRGTAATRPATCAPMDRHGTCWSTGRWCDRPMASHNASC